MEKDISLYHSKVKQLSRKLYYSISGYKHSVEVNDLYHEGLIALHKCYQNYDKTRNVQFWIYARTRVEGAIKDYIRTLPLVHVPQKPFQKHKDYFNEYNEFLKKHLREPTNEEIAKKLEISEEELDSIQNLNFQYENEDFVIRQDQSDNSNYFIVDDLHHCLNHISKFEKNLIVMRVLHEVTLEELTKQLDLSKNTIIAKTKLALDKLKNCLKQFGWSIEDIHELY